MWLADAYVIITPIYLRHQGCNSITACCHLLGGILAASMQDMSSIFNHSRGVTQTSRQHSQNVVWNSGHFERLVLVLSIHHFTVIVGQRESPTLEPFYQKQLKWAVTMRKKRRIIRTWSQWQVVHKRCSRSELAGLQFTVLISMSVLAKSVTWTSHASSFLRSCPSFWAKICRLYCWQLTTLITRGDIEITLLNKREKGCTTCWQLSFKASDNHSHLMLHSLSADDFVLYGDVAWGAKSYFCLWL